MGTIGWRLVSWAVCRYDRAYRLCRRLDDAVAAVPPLLCVEVRRCVRGRVPPDGLRLAAGDRFGMIHLDNPTVQAIHRDQPGPMTIGLKIRRQRLASLSRLALELLASLHPDGARRFGALEGAVPNGCGSLANA